MLKRICKEYAATAKDREQAIRFVKHFNNSKGAIRLGDVQEKEEKIIDTDYQTENLSLKEELKKRG